MTAGENTVGNRTFDRPFTIRLTDHDHEAVANEAERDGLTISSVVRSVMRRHLASEGRRS